MQRGVLSVFVVLLSALLWAIPTTQAQDLYVTNLDQLVAEAYSTDYSVYLPFSPWDWRAFSLYGGEPWWLDCSQMSCDGLFQTSTELSAGVPAYSVVLLQNVLTGETIIQPDGLTDVVATVLAPSGYQPATNSWNGWMWNWYEQVVDQPDSWGLSPGEVPPPVITFRALLADVSNYAAYAAYESNLEAEAEAAQAAQAATATMSGGGFAMDDDDDDGGVDPCTLTSLTQPFYVTNMVRNASGSTTITWQSCQFFRYLVWEANSLSTNTQWFPTAYVWGATNASLTSWTDTAITNNDGSTVTQRFYRVQRLLGSPIAAGGLHSVVARQDGTLWAWGNNDGCLGDGLNSRIYVGDQNDAVEVYLPYPSDVADAATCGIQNVTNVVVVAAGGDDYTVVVDATGTVWTVGENTEGQLGTGLGTSESGTFIDTNFYSTPLPVVGLSNIVNVAAGFQHTLALRSDGTVWAWGNDVFDNGYNASGALGAGYAVPLGCTNLPIPVMIPTRTNIVAIAAGNGFSLALDTSGNVWGWGDNEDGQIGGAVTGGGAGTNVPTVVQGISNVIAIAAGDGNWYDYLYGNGEGHSVALTADKTVWTWGNNESGQLGRSVGNIASTPGRVPGLSNIVAIAAGYAFSLAVSSNGEVYAWGDNNFGELGTNSVYLTSSTNPILVAGISDVVWVSAPRGDDELEDVTTSAYIAYNGGVHALAMTLDPVDGSGQMTNHYWSWGDSTFGQVGNGVNGGGTNQVSQYAPAGHSSSAPAVSGKSSWEPTAVSPLNATGRCICISMVRLATSIPTQTTIR